MEINHIILKTSNINETKKFYESRFKIKNREGGVPGYVTFKFGEFVLGFSEDPSFSKAHAQSIGHLGLEVPTKKEVDSIYNHIKEIDSNVSKQRGGMGQGPYRFYVNDPNGYTLEIGTWDGASD